ncbi:MAG: hypothetical protein M0Z66_16235 [Thermaerobacter sp.]|nr:hypothetical protein [Thermaerobacter sp.]
MSAADVVVRSLVLSVALLVLNRIIGKRLVGEVSAVDLVVGATVGTIAGSTSVSTRVPLWGPSKSWESSRGAAPNPPDGSIFPLRVANLPRCPSGRGPLAVPWLEGKTLVSGAASGTGFLSPVRSQSRRQAS